MARMYPSEPPTGGSAAEIQMFHLLQPLPDDYRVFHSVRLLKREHEERDKDKHGEIDFVVLHPSYGMLLMEVKGGKLRRDGVKGIWYSEDASGVEHRIHDPFQQVAGQRWLLLGLIKNAVTTRRFDYHLQQGVALIQTVVEGAIATHAPRSSVIDSTDIPDMEAALQRVYNGELDHPLSEGAIEAATGLLSPSLSFVKVGLNSRFEEIERTRIEPTESQGYLLEHFELTPRASVRGCAGSGKTLIAMEKARRLARAGQEVLFLCYNKRLASWVSGAIGDGTFPLNRVKVRHFHGLADEACATAGFPLFPDTANPDWENVPARLESALSKAPMKFDAIVVDEGQDFRDEWWLLIMGELLRRPDDDPFYVFYDANQRIYTKELQLPANLPTYPLVHNLRNTRQVFEEVVRYFSADQVPKSAGPEGVEVMRVAEPGLKGVHKALNELVNEQKVATSDIIILTGRSKENSCLQEGHKLGNIGLTWHPPKKGEVQVATIHAFKGLEKGVVILMELESYFPDKRDVGESLFYIGASRATRHLVLVGPELPEAVA